LVGGGTGGNGNCFGAADLSQSRGFLDSHLYPDGEMMVNVHVRHALPSTTYIVFQRCIGQIGTLTTNATGVGNATITFSPLVTGVNLGAYDTNGTLIDEIDSAPMMQ
jgi:hypothetical protein